MYMKKNILNWVEIIFRLHVLLYEYNLIDNKLFIHFFFLANFYLIFLTLAFDSLSFYLDSILAPDDGMANFVKKLSILFWPVFFIEFFNLVIPLFTLAKLKPFSSVKNFIKLYSSG